ncbi:MAG: HEAT repeat domain-containing protein, partial [Thermoleophilia bacterium]|nr:HEAT repeat domain-containing protein [Thermoleophilia bacterium]
VPFHGTAGEGVEDTERGTTDSPLTSSAFPAVAMRNLLLLALLVGLVGCSKKPPAEPPADSGDGVAPRNDDAPADTTAKDRAYWLNALKGNNFKARQEAADELAVWVETDPETIAALVELLKDKSNAGAGKILPNRINSTREAAATVLLHGGAKGEAALKDKGLAILRDGLADPDAAVREHTAYAVGVLGPVARSLSPDVMKLCSGSDANVWKVAFDSLRAIGITDTVGYVVLLGHDNRDVVLAAAELLPELTDVPEATVPALTRALKQPDPGVRSAVAAALATAGPKAAPAAAALAEAAGQAYPKQHNPKMPITPAEGVFWRALAMIGEPAVQPTAGLLTHPNPVVRASAALVLGEIGPPSKAVTDKLKEALKDSIGEVAIEAACALCRLGEAKDEAVELMKRAIDGPGGVAKAAIEALPRMGEAGYALVPGALAKLGGGPLDAMFAAVGLVGMLDPAEAAKHAAAVGKLATHPEPQIRSRVGVVLESLGPAASPAADSLGKALATEKLESIRDQFADALVAMGPGAKPALPAMLAKAREPSGEVARRGRLLVGVAVADPTSKDVADSLLKVAAESDAGARAAACPALAKLDPIPPVALAKLVSLANTDSATGVRVASLRALASAGPKAQSVKADVEKIATGRIPEFALLAKVALAAIDGDVKRAAADVRAGLSDRNAQVRAAAVDSLLLVGPAVSDLPALLKLLRSPGAAVREASAACVGRLGPAAKEAVP